MAKHISVEERLSQKTLSSPPPTESGWHKDKIAIIKNSEGLAMTSFWSLLYLLDALTSPFVQFMSSWPCCEMAKADGIRAYVGKTLRLTGGKIYKVAEIIIHPRRDKNMKAFDQALLRFEESIQVSDSTRPVCLPRAEPSPGSMVMASGWGNVDPIEKTQGRDTTVFLNLFGQILNSRKKLQQLEKNRAASLKRPSDQLQFVWLKTISNKGETGLCFWHYK